MLFLKNLTGYEYCLITNCGGSIYGSDGNLKQTGVALEPKLMNGAVKVSGVSILVYDGTSFEVATECEQGMKKYKGDVNPAELIAYFASQGGFIVRLQSKGKAGNTRYRQTIFIYNENNDVNGVVTQLGLREVGA